MERCIISDPRGSKGDTLKSTPIPVSPRLSWLIAFLLLAVLGTSHLVAISRKALTNDELIHIPAGYYYWTFGDFHLNAEHPPLVKLWASLPLLMYPRVESESPREKSVQDRFTFFYGFWQARARAYPAMSFWPRLMMIPFALGLGLLIFVYARKLFGNLAGLFALLLYCVEPTMLAHGRIVHTDVPGALAYLAFFFVLHRYVEAPGLGRAVALASVAGAALLVKYSMIVLAPVLAAVFVVELLFTGKGERGRAALRHAVALAIVLILVNSAYGFQHPALNATDRAIIAGQLPYGEGMAGLVPALSQILPTYFPFGLYLVMAHNSFGHAGSLLGRYSDAGWWYYFPVAFALKTSLPFLFAAAASLAWAVFRAARDRALTYVSLLAPLVLYGALAMTSHINIGVRHILPVVPFLLILVGGWLASLVTRWRLAGGVVALLLLTWGTAEAVRVFPDYTAYMNPLAKDPGWRYLSDSNVEWGDDVQDLAVWLKARGISRIRGALMGGGTTLAYMGIDTGNLLGVAGPDTDYVAIGASFLNGSTVPFGGPGSGRETDHQRVEYFKSYRTLQPEAVFGGGSIYLYRVRQ